MLPPGPIDLPGLLASFHASHPGVTVRVREGSAPDILAGLRRDELDVAFTGVEPDALEEGLDGRADARRGAAADHAAGPPAARRWPSWAACRSSATGAARRCATRSTGRLPATPDIVFETDELVSVRELVARGLGVSIVPRSTVDGDGPPVQAIPVGLERPLTVVWRERRQPPAAAAFLSFVRGALVG